MSTSDRIMNDFQDWLGIIVVWYNPSKSQIANSANYKYFSRQVLVVDNSSTKVPCDITRVSELQYYWMGKNIGIASALNHGCRLAIEKGLKSVLLLDQDSVFSPSMIKEHIATAKSIFADPRVAVVATASQIQRDQLGSHTFEVKSAITSGSIIRLSSWQDIGGVRDELFIDEVDHDFCIRLYLRGFRVLVNPLVHMRHRVGDPIEKKIFGILVKSSNHSWIRRYYQVRNSLFLRSWYPKESKPWILYCRDMLEMIIGILLLEQDRGRKLYAMMLGIFDFYRNRMGACRFLLGGEAK